MMLASAERSTLSVRRGPADRHLRTSTFVLTSPILSFGPAPLPPRFRPVTFSKVSSLVADPGAPRQCVHADTIVLPCPQYPEASMAPLLTFFVALQDVEEGMGHTVFLPRTHTAEAHALWNRPQKQKEALLTVHKAVQSELRAGEAAVFDSRLLHCGRANTSAKRRILFYFTLSEQAEWPLPNGLHGSNSIRAEDWRRWRVSDFVS